MRFDPLIFNLLDCLCFVYKLVSRLFKGTVAVISSDPMACPIHICFLFTLIWAKMRKILLFFYLKRVKFCKLVYFSLQQDKSTSHYNRKTRIRNSQFWDKKYLFCSGDDGCESIISKRRVISHPENHALYIDLRKIM